jgi:AGCS family alanine or glycine:cation symporter
VVVIGAVATGGVIWTIAEILNGLMVLPNLIGLVLLSGTVFRLTRAYDFKATERSASASRSAASPSTDAPPPAP